MTVQDFLAVGPAEDAERRPDYRRAPTDTGAVGALIRIATCISGRVEVMVNCAPLFDYGTVSGTWDYKGDGYEAMTVAAKDADVQLELAGSIRLGVLGARGYGRTTLTEGQSAYVVLSWGEAKVPGSQQEAFRALDATIDYWRDWLSTARIPDHPWKPYLDRSALTLKALSYAPTGAIMAAATTSLPETPGGERNWDYRYTWIRDSAFMLRALYRLGFDWEALEYFGFILDAVTGGDLNRRPELQIMYGIGGERDLTERTLDHLSGYQGARPVRIGNGDAVDKIWRLPPAAADDFLALLQGARPAHGHDDHLLAVHVRGQEWRGRGGRQVDQRGELVGRTGNRVPPLASMEKPATLCAPPRIATGSPSLQANWTPVMTSATPEQRRTRAGCMSIAPFQIHRAFS